MSKGRLNAMSQSAVWRESDIQLKAYDIQGYAVAMQRYLNHVACRRKPSCLQMSAVGIESAQ